MATTEPFFPTSFPPRILGIVGATVEWATPLARLLACQLEYVGEVFCSIAGDDALAVAVDLLGHGLDAAMVTLYRRHDVPEVGRLAQFLADALELAGGSDPLVAGAGVLALQATEVLRLDGEPGRLGRPVAAPGRPGRPGAGSGRPGRPVAGSGRPGRPVAGPDLADAVRLAEAWNERFPGEPVAIPEAGRLFPAARQDGAEEAEARRAVWSARPDEVEDVLRFGALRVRREAAATLDSLREARCE